MTTSQIARRSAGQLFGWLGVRIVFGICVLGFAILSAASCAKAQARSAPDGPPLDMPAPPARVLAPVDEPISSSPAEPAEPTATPPSANRRPARRTSEPAPKPETVTPPAETAIPPATPEAARPAESVPTLRAPGSAEKPIRDRLVLAQRDLARVDYAKLSGDGRLQYEQSKRFIQQAEQALKDQNFVFAQTLADKAATLASELLGR